MSNETNYEIRIDNLPGEGQINDDMDFIPLITDEDDEAIKDTKYPEVIPILPLKKYCFISWGFNSNHSWKKKINETYSGCL